MAFMRFAFVAAASLVLSSCICALRGEPLARWRDYTHKNPAYTVLRFEPEPAIDRLLVVDHL